MNKMLAVPTMLVTILVAAAAAVASSAAYDFDRTIDFSHWKRFAWKDAPPPDISLVDGRIQRTLEAGLVAKGYSLTTERAEADFLISYHAAAWRDVQIHDRFHGVPFGRALQIDAVPMGTLVVDVHERATGKLVWRGMVSDALSRDPEKADKRTGKAVTRLLDKFPSSAQR
jgi:hypothetical protein